MKNLFSFAKKELSQDAFLRWLFENYKENDLKDACKSLFDEFTNFELDFDKVEDLTTVAQWKKIDVSIWFKIEGVDYLIVIEDKTDTDEHNQLIKYDGEIKKHIEYWKGKDKQREKYKVRTVKEQNIYRVFYKTNLITDAEEARIDEANKQIDNSHCWKKLNIKGIYGKLFDIKSKNIILSDYIDYIAYLNDELNCDKEIKEWSSVAWNSFFCNYKCKHESIVKCVSRQQQGHYYYMKLFINGHERDLPSLEIRSQIDETKSTITFRIVIYDFDKHPSAEKIKEWQRLIKGQGFALNNKKDHEKHKQIANIKYTFTKTKDSVELKQFIEDSEELFVNAYNP